MNEELSRANYLLSEIESWEQQGLIDRELAQKLSSKYKEQRDQLLGLTTSTPAKDRLAPEDTLHNQESRETLPDPLFNIKLNRHLNSSLLKIWGEKGQSR